MVGRNSIFHDGKSWVQITEKMHRIGETPERKVHRFDNNPLMGARLNMICAHPDCNETNDVHDYVRTFTDEVEESDWEEWKAEPIALCPCHSVGREPFNET